MINLSASQIPAYSGFSWLIMELGADSGSAGGTRTGFICLQIMSEKLLILGSGNKLALWLAIDKRCIVYSSLPR